MRKTGLARLTESLSSVVGVALLAGLCLSASAQTAPGGAVRSSGFLSGDSSSAVVVTSENASPLVPVELRAGHRAAFFSHRWLQIQTSRGPVTLGFGSALLPFIDRGQVTVQDAQGREEHEYPLHILPFYLDFGRAPGMGREVGKALYISQARADQIVEEQRHRRIIFPYVPLFHDCRTYVCAMQATLEGKSKLPCYLLLKGYW